MPTTSLPSVSLTHADQFKVTNGRAPFFRIEDQKHALVVDGARHWLVTLTSTPCNLGGRRMWFCCPECDTRRLTLFISDHRLSCRSCLRLRFDTQHMDRRTRTHHAIEKLRARLGWKPGVLTPYGRKPLGMRWSRFGRMVKELEALEESLFASLKEWAERAETGIERRRERTHP